MQTLHIGDTLPAFQIVRPVRPKKAEQSPCIPAPGVLVLGMAALSPCPASSYAHEPCAYSPKHAQNIPKTCPKSMQFYFSLVD